MITDPIRQACGRPTWRIGITGIPTQRPLSSRTRRPVSTRPAPRRVSTAISPRISIHAPARGATRRERRHGSGCRFRSTRPHGARHCALCNRFRLDVFRSTRPHGAQPKSRTVLDRFRSFDPRARTGRDRLCLTSFLASLNAECSANRAKGREEALHSIQIDYTKTLLFNQLYEARTLPGLGARFGFARSRVSKKIPNIRRSYDQRAVEVSRRLCADMFDPPLPIGAEIIITEALRPGQ